MIFPIPMMKITCIGQLLLIMLVGTDIFQTVSTKLLLDSGIRIERKGDYLDLIYGFFKFKADNKSTWYLTIEQGSVDSDKVKGLCGNYDGNPNSEISYVFLWSLNFN